MMTDQNDNEAQNRKMNVFYLDDQKYGLTRNLLNNFVVRDAPAVNASFDERYAPALAEADKLFSDAACIWFIAMRADTGLHDHYKDTLIGLMSSNLSSLGGVGVLVRNGLPLQAMILIRQAVEICTTIIHICGDPNDKALTDFRSGDYKSTDSVARAKKAIPIIGMFWGFLSTTFVHVNNIHASMMQVKPYDQSADRTMQDVLTCLRTAIWLSYLTAELAFPSAVLKRRYWIPREIDGRNAVSYEPTDEERQWATAFLGLEDVDAEDLAEGADFSAFDGPER